MERIRTRVRGGRKHRCERAAIRRTLAAADASRELDGAPVRLAPRGAVSAAMIDAAHRCGCAACPGWLRQLAHALPDDRVMARHAKHAARIGAGARIGGGLTVADIDRQGRERERMKRASVHATAASIGHGDTIPLDGIGARVTAGRERDRARLARVTAGRIERDREHAGREQVTNARAWATGTGFPAIVG